MPLIRCSAKLNMHFSDLKSHLPRRDTNKQSMINNHSEESPTIFGNYSPEKNKIENNCLKNSCNYIIAIVFFKGGGESNHLRSLPPPSMV